MYKIFGYCKESTQKILSFIKNFKLKILSGTVGIWHIRKYYKYLHNFKKNNNSCNSSNINSDNRAEGKLRNFVIGQSRYLNFKIIEN